MRVSSILRLVRELLGRGGVRHDFSPLSVNELDGGSIRGFVLEWNTKFPIDRWWREKHSVAFNSAPHREVSVIDMRIEWEEDELYSKLRADSGYTINSGDIFRKKVAVGEEENLKQFLEEEKEFDYSHYDDGK